MEGYVVENLGVMSRTIASERRQISKVPEMTLWFWVTKILTTAMGEAASDYLVHRFVPQIVVILTALVFSACIGAQLMSRRYVAWVYWLNVAMVSVFGTMAADVVHIEFGISYSISTVCFIVLLAGILAAWYKTEGTLSIHSIVSPKRELFYWATVMTTFALGTAAGDLTAFTLGLGFLASGMLFALMFAIPAVSFWLLRINGVISFWLAYILTRPLGASFADWADKPGSLGGLGWGEAQVAIALSLLIAACVAYLAVSRIDNPSGE